MQLLLAVQPLAVQQLQARQRAYGGTQVCASWSLPQLCRAAVTSNELVLLEADTSKGPVNFASDHLIWQAMRILTLTTS